MKEILQVLEDATITFSDTQNSPVLLPPLALLTHAFLWPIVQRECPIFKNIHVISKEILMVARFNSSRGHAMPVLGRLEFEMHYVF